MAITYITLTHSDDLSLEMRADTQESAATAKRVAAYFEKIAVGCGRAKFDLQVAGGNGAKASGTLSLTASVVTDTASVMGVTFTEVPGVPASSTEFRLGISDAVTAANLAAAINAHPTLANCVVASVVSSVITLTAAQPGPLGNLVSLASTGGISASGTHLAGGVAPTPKVLHCGL